MLTSFYNIESNEKMPILNSDNNIHTHIWSSCIFVKQDLPLTQ